MKIGTLDRAGFVLTALSLGAVQFNLLVGQSVLFIPAALLWLVVVIREGRRPDAPAFMLPLVVYAALTLVSAALSPDPAKSFIDSRQLLLFLMVPVVARFVRGDRALRTLDLVIAIGAAGALVGIVQFAMLGFDNLNQRPVGPLSHWMTYSGVLMLVACAAIARLVFKPQQVAWPMVAVPALLVALVVTNTRNAWIGTFLAVSLLLVIRNWKLLIVPPIVAAVMLAVAPGEVQRRAQSLLNPQDPASRDRIVMWKIGADMIQDHPLFGVGPEMIDTVYGRYREAYPEAVNPTNPHLHNVPIQIAAERGLLALGAWLWFVVVAARDLWRQVKRRIAPAVAASGLAALVAMLAAGLFEYNFGDSEFLMLLLGLLALPHAAAHGQATRPATSPQPGASLS